MKKPIRYKVLSIPTAGTPIDDAIVYELTLQTEATPHDILRESAGIDVSNISSVNQASFTPGAFAWIATTKIGACYYIFQHAG